MRNAVICQVQIIVTDNTALRQIPHINQILKTSYRMYWLEDNE